jgi:metal-sulfur cluster biosynthetic enzyme
MSTRGCVLRQCAATLITLNDILMSIKGVYCVNVQQHWSPRMITWCLLEVCTTSMYSNTAHLEWHLDVNWRCVLRQWAATLITLNNILMSIGCVYYINVPQHWSPWMRPWCLLEVCTTSMCSNTDHLAWYLDVYWRWVLYQCAATLITLNDIVMSIGGVYYVNVQQHWSPWMTSWWLLEVCTTTMCSNTDHLEWDIDVYWRCELHQCAATLITLNDILMSIEGAYYENVQQHW